MPQYVKDITVEQAAKNYGIEVIFAAPPANVPVVSPDSFPLALPTQAGDFVGTCSATNSPTSWSIQSGGSGDFIISNSGIITVTAIGATRLTPSLRNLTIVATNASGSSPAEIVSVNMT